MTKSLFSDAQRNELRQMLEDIYSPPDIEEWLSGAQEQGWSFERAAVIADAVRSGAYL